MRRKLSCLTLCLAVPCFLHSSEIKITPVASVNILGGQYWVSESMPTSVGANAEVFFSPVINFSPKTALLPIYIGNFRGTKDVRELVGGGTLTQDSQNHSLSLKFTERISNNFKLKARAGYKIEYLRETKDETWGKGLFDYNKTTFGLELENGNERSSMRLGADYYSTKYPNYQSLITEDTFETSIDTATYSEISSQAGVNVLDFSALMLSVEAARNISQKALGSVHYDITLKNFKDQKTVKSSGEFSNELRSDIVHNLGFSISAITPKVSLALNDSVQYYGSNQNSFDTVNSRYTPRYYDFFQNSISPSITFMLGQGTNPVKLSLLWNISWRQYLERLAQNAAAELKAEKVSQTINTVGINFTYPVNHSLSALTSINYSDSSSNMRYEKNYKYNYYTFNYFAGIRWEL